MSRKAHLLLLCGLLVAQLVMMSLQERRGDDQPAAGNLLFRIFGPLAKIGSGAVSLVGDTWHGYVDLRGVRRDNLQLQEELRDLRMRMDALSETERENQRLRRLLAMREQRPWIETVGAKVVAIHRGPSASTLVLNRGARHGLSVDLPVVTADGVVGRIVDVGPGTSKVQMVTDPSAGLAVVFERSRDQATGLAGGTFGAALEVRYVSVLADVRVGDLARTSGLEGIYPVGLPVGVVTSVRDRADLMKEVRLRPTVHLGRLEEVLVLMTAGAGAPEGQPTQEATVARR